LFNAPDDAVTDRLSFPEFLTATSPLLSLDYDNFVRGCHLGIFPSYYEPWDIRRWNPSRLGFPLWTTDLSGFGAYVQKHIDGSEANVSVCTAARRVFEAPPSSSRAISWISRG